MTNPKYCAVWGGQWGCQTLVRCGHGPHWPPSSTVTGSVCAMVILCFLVVILHFLVVILCHFVVILGLLVLIISLSVVILQLFAVICLTFLQIY